MYTTTSKQQEGSRCKDSHLKCFITTNFDKFHRERAVNRSVVFPLKEAPYSWFSLKHFSYRSESSRDSSVECSRSGEILKNYLQKVCFSVFIDQNVAGSYFRQSCEYEI